MPFRTNSYEDFKKKQFKLAFEDSSAMNNLLTQIDQAIEDERKDKDKKLSEGLKKRLISPRTYGRKKIEIESWVSNERREVRDHQKVILDSKEKSKS